MTLFPHAAAFNEGFDSFVRGDSYNNPYPDLSDSFNSFERGYFQALKRQSLPFVSSVIRPKNRIPGWSAAVLRDAENHMKRIASE